MKLFVELRKRARHIIGPVLAATLFGYFAYHAVQGERGLLAWLKLNQQVQETEANYSRIRAERLRLDARVRLLRPESLDPDLLDERARATLGVAHPDDVVIFEAAPAPTARPGRIVATTGPSPAAKKLPPSAAAVLRISVTP
jgi:cell division protein FtsB